MTVKCYSASSAPGTNKGVSYTYSNAAGTNDTVVDGSKPTVLKSLLGTGTNMSADYANVAAASSASAIAVIPGLTGAGPGTDGRKPEDSSSAAAGTAAATQAGSGSGSGSVAGGGAATVQVAASTATGFDQGVPAAATTAKSAGGVVVRGEGWWMMVVSVVVLGVGIGGVGLL